jgi:hypothetical protein
VISFSIIACSIGIIAGACLPFVAMALVVTLGVGIGAICYAWQGVPFADVLGPSVLCLILVQIGYAAGLVLKAIAIHWCFVDGKRVGWNRGWGQAANVVPDTTIMAGPRRANAVQDSISTDKAPR